MSDTHLREEIADPDCTGWTCPNCKYSMYHVYGFECDNCGYECDPDMVRTALAERSKREAVP